MHFYNYQSVFFIERRNLSNMLCTSNSNFRKHDNNQLINFAFQEFTTALASGRLAGTPCCLPWSMWCIYSQIQCLIYLYLWKRFHNTVSFFCFLIFYYTVIWIFVFFSLFSEAMEQGALGNENKLDLSLGLPFLFMLHLSETHVSKWDTCKINGFKHFLIFLCS